MKVANFETDGRKFQIELSETTGQFSTVIDGYHHHADTLDKLKKQIIRATRREAVRLALPATIAKGSHRFIDDSARVFDIIVTGIHQRTRDVLYRSALDHKAGAVEGYGDKLLIRLTREQKDQYLDLQKAKRESAAALDAFQKKYEYSLDAIKKALAAAEQAAGITVEPDR
jgi:hypothetical protein